MLPAGFPTSAGPARDAAILAAARGGQLEVSWSPVATAFNDHTATFQVTADGVKLGGVRLAGSANLCQQVADILGASLATPRLLDEAWLQAGLQIPPQIVAPNTSDTSAMVKHSALVDAAGSLTSSGLVMPVGKPWVLGKGISETRAALYGWQSDPFVRGQSRLVDPSQRIVGDSSWLGDVTLSGHGRAGALSETLCGRSVSDGVFGVVLRPSPATPGVWVIQALSYAHDPSYVDYSSSLWFVSRECIVDGVTRDLADVLRDASLAPLASHEGVLSNLRQPGVPA